jgi:hypothetical protein
MVSCSDTNHQNNEQDPGQIKKGNSIFSGFDSIPKSKVMVVGSYHFRQDTHFNELSDENQEQIKKLVSRLAEFKPTKVVVEQQPQYDSVYQNLYQKYLLDDQVIDTLENEIFQLGFRLAKIMEHEKVYLFDDQTEFIGSLENFTFEKLGEEIAEDSVFVNRHIDVIMKSFDENEEKYNSLSLYDNIMERNSQEATKWNANRMHSYEIRAGIQKSWMGADWLARWYQRNIRMMANIMSFNNPGKDRIVIIVGDNHKWVLDTLLAFNPDFEVESSYDILKSK